MLTRYEGYREHKRSPPPAKPGLECIEPSSSFSSFLSLEEAPSARTTKSRHRRSPVPVLENDEDTERWMVSGVGRVSVSGSLPTLVSTECLCRASRRSSGNEGATTPQAAWAGGVHTWLAGEQRNQAKMSVLFLII